MEARNDDQDRADGNRFLHATSISDNDYAFVVMVIPARFAVELCLQDMCGPDENSTELTSLSLKVLYTAVNKKPNNLHVTPISHSLSDLSRHITDDNQLKETLAFERQYSKLFH